MLSLRTLGLAALVLCAGQAYAEETRLAGFTAGFVFDDQARALRPMIGVPGAAYLGDALAGGFEVAAVAPNGRLALTTSGDALYLVRLDGRSPARILLVEGGGIDRIVWSRASKAAVVYRSGASSLEVWINLEDFPERLDLALPGSLMSLLVEDDGLGAVAGVIEATGGAVYRLTRGDSPRMLAKAAEPAALAAGAAGRDLFLADRAAHEVLVVRNYRDSAGAALLAGQSQGILDPVALTVSADGATLLVADRQSRAVFSLDASSGAPLSRLALEFAPERLERIGAEWNPGADLFLLNRRRGPGDAFQILQGSAQPSVYFLPAPEMAGVVEE